MSRSPLADASSEALPPWMRRVGAGLTALLTVLFVVLLLQLREQGRRLQTLEDKLQTIENNNDLERTNALEEQLRSTVVRLQALEGLEQSVQRLSSEQDSLRQQLRSSSAAEMPPALEPSSPAPARPVRPPRPPALPQLPSNPE